MSIPANVLMEISFQELTSKKSEEYERKRLNEIGDLLTPQKIEEVLNCKDTKQRNVSLEDIFQDFLNFIITKNQEMFSMDCNSICKSYVLKVAEEKIEKLLKENGTLKNEEKCLRMQIVAQEEYVAPLIQKLEIIEKKLDKSFRKNMEDELRITRLASENNVLISRIDRTKRHFSELFTQKQMLQLQNENFKDDYEKIKEENKRLYKERKSFLSKIEKSACEIHDLKESDSFKDHEILRLKEERTAAMQAIDDISGTIETIKSDCYKVESENKGLINEVMDMRNFVQQLEQELYAFEDDYSRIQNDEELLKVGMIHLNKSENRTVEEMKIGDFGNTEEAKDVCVSDEDIHNVNIKQITTLIGKMSQVQIECKRLRKENLFLQSERTHLLRELEELRHLATSAKEDFVKVEKLNKIIKDENENLKEYIRNNSLSFQATAGELTQCKQLPQPRITGNDQENSHYTGAGNNCLELVGKENNCKNQYPQYFSNIDESNAFINNQCLELEALNRKNDLIRGELDSLKEKNLVAQKQLKSANNTLHVRAKHIQILENTNQSLKKNLENGRAEFRLKEIALIDLANQQIKNQDKTIHDLNTELCSLTLDYCNTAVERDTLRFRALEYLDHNKQTNPLPYHIVYMFSFETSPTVFQTSPEEDKENVNNIKISQPRNSLQTNGYIEGMANNVLDASFNVEDESHAISDSELGYFCEDQSNIYEVEDMRYYLFYTEEEKNMLPGFIVNARPANLDLFPCCYETTDKRSKHLKNMLNKKKLIKHIFHL
ncbi:Schizosaccharomyces specific protein [Schizosaccharomyces pombe]|uniref:Meiotic expression up-regulated protein 1/2 n=2 Tax=Schizosaccharomyces pombe (strain 972 / ATCC 24843) TaxID=284812 RepID=MEU1_SCHPO|nr:protein meu1-1 [Schizosaccharomyces pombe]Q9UTJ3.1 RecName: Full=Meiotic expression up-regulated protein 1/2 [Schizosaccharomyces pombe 972h-]BAB20280.1 Meu1 [Schizosaccharomyces pombe]CAO77643.1 sequence orphan [Schizosaccharomyces pombe]|eukprot:NP_001343034.1 protein meu1-1 [Schizosaccharomyces pombe]